MKRSYILLATVMMASAGASMLTQCSGDNSNPDAGDAATDTKPPKDVMTNDAGGDAGDAAMNTTPMETELAASDGIRIFGVTADDLVIYADLTGAAGLYAVPFLGGSAPVKIATPAGSYVAGIAETTVFVWDGVSTSTVGALHVWQSGKAYTAIVGATHSAPNGGFGASPDGKHILYTANANTAGTTGDFIGNSFDGSQPTSLVTGVDISTGNNCTPVAGFASNTEVVTSTCTVNPGDAGAPSASITTYTIAATGDGGTSFTPTPIITAADDTWSTDTAGDKILVAVTATVSATSVYPIGGGTPTPIDTKNVYQGDWTFNYLNKAGTSVFYSAPGGALYTAAVSVTPNVTTVQATGVKYLRSISSDDGYFIYSTNFDSMMFGSDLYLTKAMGGAPAATTLVGGTNGALFGLRCDRQLHDRRALRGLDREPRLRPRRWRLLLDAGRRRDAPPNHHRPVAEHLGQRQQGRLGGQLPELLGDGEQGDGVRRPQVGRRVDDELALAASVRRRCSAHRGPERLLRQRGEGPRHLHLQHQRDEHGDTADGRQRPLLRRDPLT